MFHATVIVTLRKSILDPQGKAVEHALHSLGSTAVSGVRIGKHIEFDIDAPDREAAQKISDDACKRLLANAVMEDYSVAFEERGKA